MLDLGDTADDDGAAETAGDRAREFADREFEESPRKVRGRIVRADRTPAAGIVVWCETGFGMATTDAEGRFRLGFDKQVSFVALDVREPTTPDGKMGLLLARRGVRLDAAPTEVEIALDALAPLAGRIVDEAGRPLAGALVGVLGLEECGLGRLRSAIDAFEVFANGEKDHWDEGIARARLVRSDADGAFVLEAPSSGVVRVAAVAPDHVPLVQPVEVPPPGGAVRLVVSSGGTVEGKVLDDTGVPPPNAVVAVEVEGRPWEIRQARVGPDGSYRASGLRPGRYLLTVEGRGAPFEEHAHGVSAIYGPSARRVVTIGSARAAARFDFGVAARLVRVAGRFTLDGVPPTGQYIFLADRGGKSELCHDKVAPDGGFSFEAAVAPGRYLIRVSSVGCEVEVPVSAAEVFFPLDLRRTAPIEGRARQPARPGRDPLEQYGPFAVARANREGGYEVATSDEDRGSGELGGERVRASVADEAGEPLEAGYMALVDHGGFERHDTSDTLGISIRDVPAGVYDAIAGAPGRAFERREVRLDGRPALIELRLGPEAAIEVRAIDPRTGSPVPGARLEVRFPDGRFAPDWAWYGGRAHWHVADTEGRMRWDGLAAGEYAVEAIAADGRRGRATVRLAAGETARIDVPVR